MSPDAEGAVTVTVVETFLAIQGESSWAGCPCFFIRLAGCNLRCRYCDTTYAYGPGQTAAVAQLVAEARAARTTLVEVTGGEPLLQPEFTTLARVLRDESGKQVLVETNGTLDLSRVPEGVVAVMDVKCPGSGATVEFDRGNIQRLRPYDEVKFVLCDRADYEWARDFVSRHDLARRCHAVHFSPAWQLLAPCHLAEWLVADGLPVRLQMQLHKLLGTR
jgi:7-carboxy-7-deazaguanine synthase